MSNAANLDHWLRHSAPTPQYAFSVSTEGDRLHVRCQCSAREWAGEYTPRWNGLDVEWHFAGTVHGPSVTASKEEGAR